MKNEYKENSKLVSDIDELQNYQGYVQFSDERIRKCDIFKTMQNIKLTPTQGFIYEAHFCNDKESISIKQVNYTWLVSVTPFSEIDNKDTDIQIYSSIDGDIKMAQIWKEYSDSLCDGMKVKKLKKVVFAGFVGDEK